MGGGQNCLHHYPDAGERFTVNRARGCKNRGLNGNTRTGNCLADNYAGARRCFVLPETFRINYRRSSAPLDDYMIFNYGYYSLWPLHF